MLKYRLHCDLHFKVEVEVIADFFENFKTVG